MRLLGYCTREMRQRPGRTLLTLLGIVLGVAAIVSISVTIKATRGTYRQLFETLTGRAALEVVAEGYGGFDPELAARLREIHGVRAAVPVIQTPAGCFGASGAQPVMALGVDPSIDASAREYVLLEGALFGGEEGVVLDAGFAERSGLKMRSTARLLTPTGLIGLPVVGLLASKGAALVNGGAVVFMPLPTAQRVFLLEDRVNAIQIVLDEGANQIAVQQAVGRELLPGLTVQTPASRGVLAEHLLLGTELGLGVMSVVALAAGVFVILNSFLMSLGERNRHLAILRALGARRGQVMRILLAEAALLGVVGTGLGIGLGLAMSFGLKGVMEQMLSYPLPAIGLDAGTLALALVLGPGAAVAAASVPIWRAGRRPVLDGLLDNRDVREPAYRRWPGYIGLGLLGCGFTVIAILMAEMFPVEHAAELLPIFMAILVVGCMLSIPLAIPALSKLAAAALRPIFGAEGRIGLRHLERRSTRTGLTVAVLSVTIMVALGFGSSLFASVEDARNWAERIARVDYFIRGYMPDPGLAATAALPEAMAEEIGSIDGVRQVDKINFIAAHSSGEPLMVIAMSFTDGSATRLDLEEGEPAEVIAGLNRGGIVAGTRLAQRKRLDVGDHVRISTRQGPKAFPIVGLATEYTAGGFVVYMNWPEAQRSFGKSGVHVFGVHLAADAPASTHERLAALCDLRGCRLESRATFRAIIDESMAGVIGTAWMLIMLGFVVASLGIVNTLTMNALEQTREIGVLRAIAMRRRQVRNMVLAQALAVALMSLVPGLVGGVVFGYLLNITTYPLLGVEFDFQIPLGLLVACIVIAPIVSALAAHFPARRAAGLRVITALQYE